MKTTKTTNISTRAKFLRIIAGVLGILIAGFCIAITMSYTGNPISGIIARRNAKEHVYNDLFLDGYDFYVKDVKYSHGKYEVVFQDKDINDVNFSAYCDNVGEYINNDFIHSVGYRGATYKRLTDELKDDAMTVIEPIAENRGLKIGEYTGIYPKMYYYDGELEEDSMMIPPWDTPYSRELGIKADYHIDYSSKKALNAEDIADTISKTYSELTENDFLVERIHSEFKLPNKNIVVIVKEGCMDKEKLIENIEKGIDDSNGSSEDIIVTLENEI